MKSPSLCLYLLLSCRSPSISIYLYRSDYRRHGPEGRPERAGQRVGPVHQLPGRQGGEQRQRTNTVQSAWVNTVDIFHNFIQCKPFQAVTSVLNNNFCF